MSPKLVAVMSVFNADDNLKACLQSLIPHFDEIHIYDGRYEGFACPCRRLHARSCDTTPGIVDFFSRAYPRRVRFFEMPEVMPELSKRSFSLGALSEGDVAFIIDDDEIFEGDTKALREEFVRDANWQIGYVRNSESKDPWFRLIRYWRGVMYHGCGGLSYDIRRYGKFYPENARDHQVPPQWRTQFIANGCSISHRPMVRTNARRAAEERYYSEKIRVGLATPALDF